ncbi:phosphoglucomutase/phosphomannomutase PgmG [uncultured Sphingomonas sp.]|uniref:phosphoglucomutase/phosphomannomutase PgmG n=1 Tax=uncultured Sphingomonas sp. TaxID=158754 RepID=UPI0035CAC5BE
MPHRLDPAILREYDIRGVVGAALGREDVRAIGRGFATRVRRAGGRRVVVGRDGRTTSPMLEAALIEGLTAAGVDVVRIGLGPTPMLYYAEAELEVDGGIQVTGSHNPPDYNGFKLVLGHRSFFGDDIQELAVLAAADDRSEGDGEGAEAGEVTDADVMDDYVDRLMRGFSGGAYRIGWDAGNGAAGPVVERLVKRLPGEHHLLFTDVNGTFPNHHPDPTIEDNLADLKALVADRQLDFGVAFDGDGDRIGAVDGLGRMVWGDQLLSILAEPVLLALPGATIVGDVKSSDALFGRIVELGGTPLMARTGHAPMKAAMIAAHAPLAGEMSGHIFFAHGWYGFDDALLAAIRLIEALTGIGRSLADLRGAMPALVNTPDIRIDVDDARKRAVVDEVIARLRASGGNVDRTDGVRIATPDGWWLLRASNTQPMLTARAEARTPEGLDRLLAELDAQLRLSGVER